MGRCKRFRIDESIKRKSKRLEKVFKPFGLVPIAFSRFGVDFYLEGHGNIFVDFTDRSLVFIVPLLKELLRYRNYAKKFEMDFSLKNGKKWYEELT